MTRRRSCGVVFQLSSVVQIRDDFNLMMNPLNLPELLFHQCVWLDLRPKPEPTISST